MKLLNLSTGNTKTGKGILIWNIPAIKTCIGCTQLCASKCYARKSERLYPNVLPSRELNKLEADSIDFVENMIYTIEKISKKKAFKGLFRIHESGDFYNQEYFDSWVQIAKAFPQIKFLAFTKSHQLNLIHDAENFNVVYSEFPDTKVFSQNMPVAKAVAKAEEMKENEFLCGGSCKDCNVCWYLEKNETVYFEFH